MARGPFSGVLAALALTLALAAPVAAATERTVMLRNGETIKAERLYPTYTTLVVLHGETQMRLVPNDQVQSIDGVPFEQVYWGDAIYGQDTVAAAPAAEAAATGTAEPATGGLLPLGAGTARQYEVTGTRTTWIRNGRVMDRKPTESLTGVIRQTVVGQAPEGPVAVRESVIERVGGQPAREAQILQLLERRAAGTFLVGYGAQQGGEVGTAATQDIGVPPQLWPSRLEVGQVWVVGPFERQNMYHVARMEVVGQEPVTVPAGTYTEAFRVRGFGHVWAGSQSLDVGRLVTDHGTIETTTWVVPGVGPVKEERKVHLHQGYFPAGQTGRETPFVVEEVTTRNLSRFQAGQE